MDEAVYVRDMMRDIYQMAKENPELGFGALLDKYCEEGFDVEGYEDYCWKAYNRAHSEES